MRAALFFLAVWTARGVDLAGKLDSLIDTNPLAARANIGVHVTDLKTGKALYARNENRFFLPASNMKLFTSALALEKLGGAYRFETRIVLEPEGDLVLAGAGDPSMSGRAYPYRRDALPGSPLQAIEELADQVVAGGLLHVAGDVVGDDRLYPWAPYPPTWSQDDVLHESGAPVSALSVADNVIAISIAPGLNAGDPAVLSLWPSLEYFAIDNRVTTTTAPGQAQILVSRIPGSRQIVLAGRVPAGAGAIREQVALDDPALYAAFALYDALTRRGVTVTGRPVARHRSPDDPYRAPEGRTLATRTSPPLTELLQMLDKVSENLHAELMLREVGRAAAAASGTRESGLQSLNEFLTGMGASPSESRLDDASGLSRNAQVTPRLVTRLLSHMFRSDSRDTWVALLPVGGEDGTLSRRLCCTSSGRAIHAKTGTLNRAIALSGYADSKTRGWLAFSILVNNFAAPSAEVQAWVDRIALALVE